MYMCVRTTFAVRLNRSDNGKTLREVPKLDTGLIKSLPSILRQNSTGFVQCRH